MLTTQRVLATDHIVFIPSDSISKEVSGFWVLKLGPPEQLVPSLWDPIIIWPFETTGTTHNYKVLWGATQNFREFVCNNM